MENITVFTREEKMIKALNSTSECFISVPSRSALISAKERKTLESL